MDYNPASVSQLPNESTAVIIFERPDGQLLTLLFGSKRRVTVEVTADSDETEVRFVHDSPLEGDGFELAVPQQDDHTNATIADSPVWLSTKVEPILWPLTASLTHHDEWK